VGHKRVCIKGRTTTFDDHGRRTQRVVGQGLPFPTKIGLSDVLLAWNVQREQGMDEGEDDVANVVKRLRIE